MIRSPRRLRTRLLQAAIPSILAFGVLLLPNISLHRGDRANPAPDALGAGAAPASTSFDLFPANNNVLTCLERAAAGRSKPGGTPTAHATVIRGQQNDTMRLDLSGFPPNIDFDLFTVEKNTNPFGLSWYQSDVNVDEFGNAHIQIQTILLDQIFGMDINSAGPPLGFLVKPTNTFHVGFRFNDPQQAFDLGCEGTATRPIVTPFNGEHNAGPLAFITHANPATGLGPLCTNPASPPLTDPFGDTLVCNP